MSDLEAIKQAVIKGKRKDIAGLVQVAIDAGADPQEIINGYMIEAMKEVGARFEAKKNLCSGNDDSGPYHAIRC